MSTTATSAASSDMITAAMRAGSSSSEPARSSVAEMVRPDRNWARLLCHRCGERLLCRAVHSQASAAPIGDGPQVSADCPKCKALNFIRPVSSP